MRFPSPQLPPGRAAVLGAAGLLALIATTRPCAAASAAKPIAANHPAVEALKTALDSGRAYGMDFAVLPPAASPEAAERQRRAVDRVLRRLRADLPATPAYSFLAGLEFALGAPEDGQVAVTHPVGEETAEHPSTFRLSARWPRQVYTLFRVTAAQDERTWRLHALLVPVGEGWKSAGLTLSLERFGTTDAEAALAAAVQEAAAGHHPVALGLLGLANELSRTPRTRRSGFQERLKAAYDPLAKELGLPDKPVATVQTPRGKFAFSYANARVYRRGAYLLLFREAPLAERPSDWQTHHRQLAAAFLKDHPEAKQYFVGIAINERTIAPDGYEHDDRSLFLHAELESE